MNKEELQEIKETIKETIKTEIEKQKTEIEKQINYIKMNELLEKQRKDLLNIGLQYRRIVS